MKKLLEHLILLLIVECRNHLVHLPRKRLPAGTQRQHQVLCGHLALDRRRLPPIGRKNELECLAECLERRDCVLPNVCDPAVQDRYDGCAQLVVCQRHVDVQLQVFEHLVPLIRLLRFKLHLKDAQQNVYVLGFQVFEVALANLVRQRLHDEERVEEVERGRDRHMGQRVAEDLLLGVPELHCARVRRCHDCAEVFLRELVQRLMVDGLERRILGEHGGEARHRHLAHEG
mmetsp:Transcript_4215/g.10780  ORF Transcript_4215/g.10780 Transcript_4215/m.10780 type:complete len:230 (-) Transcript_4215:1651-2340(-)